MSKKRFVIAGMIALATVGVGLAAADWSAAKSKVEDFRRQYQEAKKMTPEETRRIVTAICEADEEQRGEVGREISDRVKSTVQSNDRRGRARARRCEQVARRGAL